MHLYVFYLDRVGSMYLPDHNLTNMKTYPGVNAYNKEMCQTVTADEQPASGRGTKSCQNITTQTIYQLQPIRLLFARHFLFSRMKAGYVGQGI